MQENAVSEMKNVTELGSIYFDLYHHEALAGHELYRMIMELHDKINNDEEETFTPSIIRDEISRHLVQYDMARTEARAQAKAQYES